MDAGRPWVCPQLGRALRPGLSSALGKPGCSFFTSTLGREHRGLWTRGSGAGGLEGVCDAFGWHPNEISPLPRKYPALPVSALSPEEGPHGGQLDRLPPSAPKFFRAPPSDGAPAKPWGCTGPSPAAPPFPRLPGGTHCPCPPRHAVRAGAAEGHHQDPAKRPSFVPPDDSPAGKDLSGKVKVGSPTLAPRPSRGLPRISESRRGPKHQAKPSTGKKTHRVPRHQMLLPAQRKQF